MYVYCVFLEGVTSLHYEGKVHEIVFIDEVFQTIMSKPSTVHIDSNYIGTLLLNINKFSNFLCLRRRIWILHDHVLIYQVWQCYATNNKSLALKASNLEDN